MVLSAIAVAALAIAMATRLAAQVGTSPPMKAACGEIPGLWELNDRGDRSRYVPSPGFGPGIYEVRLSADRLLAFNLESAETTVCEKQAPVDLSQAAASLNRYRCRAPWESRRAFFVAGANVEPGPGERIDWQTSTWSPLPMPAPTGDGQALHVHTAVATPALLQGRQLVTTAWFSGQYPPEREFDPSRDDDIAFGRYRLSSRAVFLGPSVYRPTSFLYRSDALVKVENPHEWMFLPEDASEKTNARLTKIYRIPRGHLFLLEGGRDHEGAGVLLSMDLIESSNGRWQRLVTAECLHMY